MSASISNAVRVVKLSHDRDIIATGEIYPFGAPEVTLVLIGLRVAQSLLIGVLRSALSFLFFVVFFFLLAIFDHLVCYLQTPLVFRDIAVYCSTIIFWWQHTIDIPMNLKLIKLLSETDSACRDIYACKHLWQMRWVLFMVNLPFWYSSIYVFSKALHLYRFFDYTCLYLFEVRLPKIWTNIFTFGWFLQWIVKSLRGYRIEKLHWIWDIGRLSFTWEISLDSEEIMYH